MTEEPRLEAIEDDVEVEDLDVPPEDAEDVKGGFPACATGVHIKEATISH